jgi:hypothetical protein
MWNTSGNTLLNREEIMPEVGVQFDKHGLPAHLLAIANSVIHTEFLRWQHRGDQRFRYEGQVQMYGHNYFFSYTNFIVYLVIMADIREMASNAVSLVNNILDCCH